MCEKVVLFYLYICNYVCVIISLHPRDVNISQNESTKQIMIRKKYVYGI